MISKVNTGVDFDESLIIVYTLTQNVRLNLILDLVAVNVC